MTNKHPLFSVMTTNLQRSLRICHSNGPAPSFLFTAGVHHKKICSLISNFIWQATQSMLGSQLCFNLLGLEHVNLVFHQTCNFHQGVAHQPAFSEDRKKETMSSAKLILCTSKWCLALRNVQLSVPIKRIVHIHTKQQRVTD